MQLKNTVSTREMEIKDLKLELKEAMARVKELKKDLAKESAKVETQTKTE